MTHAALDIDIGIECDVYRYRNRFRYLRYRTKKTKKRYEVPGYAQSRYLVFDTRYMVRTLKVFFRVGMKNAGMSGDLNEKHYSTR